MFIGFFPLTTKGMFLQVWQNKMPKQRVDGQMLFVPYGNLLLVPSDTIHAGGFKSSDNGNLRFHLYIAVGGSELPRFQKNCYTEETDRRKELSDRFTNAPGLEDLIGPFFHGCV